MDFGIIFQLRDKKFWWLDVIFYFTMSLLVATMLCYLIFIFKNNMQAEDIKNQEAALQTVGTQQQKDYEKDVISYQRKIADFARLLKNHEFASNVFVFMENQTMPNVWFKQFNLDEKGAQIQVSGEADDMKVFVRQVAGFENNEYVKSVDLLNSSLNESARVNFNLSLSLNQKIFDYIAENEVPLLETTSPSSGEPLTNQEVAQSSAKLITLFDLSSPEVTGIIDQTAYTIELDVPFGTDVQSLTPTINISTNATINPLSETAQDFINPVLYTVTAQDGTAQSYTATVRVLPKPKSAAGTIILWIIFIVIMIAAGLAAFMFFREKMRKNKEANNNAVSNNL